MELHAISARFERPTFAYLYQLVRRAVIWFVDWMMVSVMFCLKESIRLTSWCVAPLRGFICEFLAAQFLDARLFFEVSLSQGQFVKPTIWRARRECSSTATTALLPPCLVRPGTCPRYDPYLEVLDAAQLPTYRLLQKWVKHVSRNRGYNGITNCITIFIAISWAFMMINIDSNDGILGFSGGKSVQKPTSHCANDLFHHRLVVVHQLEEGQE